MHILLGMYVINQHKVKMKTLHVFKYLCGGNFYQVAFSLTLDQIQCNHLC